MQHRLLGRLLADQEGALEAACPASQARMFAVECSR
jgi:hypothetical protein